MRTRALETIRTTGKVSSSPSLDRVASRTLMVHEFFQNVKENNDRFNELAVECCALMYALYRTRRNIPENKITISYVRAAQNLDYAISEVSCFALRCASRKWWQRLFRTQTDTDKVAACQRKLDQALSLFNFDQSQAILALARQCYEEEMNSHRQTHGGALVDASSCRRNPLSQCGDEEPPFSVSTDCSHPSNWAADSPATAMRPSLAHIFTADFPSGSTLSGRIQVTNIGGSTTC
ncbi:hypothetical protein BDN72DRAFT_651311 [Pluteus cervinus]|uniref:Uncharacterized protein n=1 Tax=Pluteus cervinus TaxID=181527 RepID=A0ACD3ASU5_9AGAR|nr:hypothetical protein BDN72DRAFT_651311 [Pluteus cervinus]